MLKRRARESKAGEHAENGQQPIIPIESIMVVDDVGTAASNEEQEG